MPDRAMDWDDLQTFLMVARHHTLSGAARAMHVQQPTMGRRLEAMEQRSGARLLQKTPQGYVLTEAGEAVLGNVERIEMETLAIERLIAGRDVRLEGVVRLTTVDTLAAEVLSPVIAGFCRAYPAVRVEVVATGQTLSLSKREADVALRLVRFTQGELSVRKVGEIGYGLYASPGYLDWHGPLGAAGSHAIVLPDADEAENAETLWLHAAAPDAAVAFRTSSRVLQRAAARDGIGIACLPRYLGDDGPGLVRLPPPGGLEPPPVRDLWLGVHTDLRHMPRIRAFTAALQDGLKAAASRLRPP